MSYEPDTEIQSYMVRGMRKVAVFVCYVALFLSPFALAASAILFWVGESAWGAGVLAVDPGILFLSGSLWMLIDIRAALRK